MLKRVKVVLYSDQEITLPKSYSRILQGAIYATFTKRMAKKLHDIGFRVGNKRIKLFTFSVIFGRHREKGRTITFKPPIHFYFTTALPNVLSSFLKGLMKKGKMRIGKYELWVHMIEEREVRAQNEVDLKTLSPLVVSVRDGRKHKYLAPSDERFFDIIKKNLYRKLIAKLGKEVVSENLNIEILPLFKNRRWRKVVTFFKGTPITAWEGMLKLRGSKKLIELALVAGLGARNAQGFGMMIPRRM